MSQYRGRVVFFLGQVSAHPGRRDGSLRPQVRMSSRPRRRRPSRRQASISPHSPGLSAKMTGTQAEKSSDQEIRASGRKPLNRVHVNDEEWAPYATSSQCTAVGATTSPKR